MIKASILKSQEIITILASSKKSISVVFNHFSLTTISWLLCHMTWIPCTVIQTTRYLSMFENCYPFMEELIIFHEDEKDVTLKSVALDD